MWQVETPRGSPKRRGGLEEEPRRCGRTPAAFTRATPVQTPAGPARPLALSAEAGLTAEPAGLGGLLLPRRGGQRPALGRRGGLPHSLPPASAFVWLCSSCRGRRGALAVSGKIYIRNVQWRNPLALKFHLEGKRCSPKRFWTSCRQRSAEKGHKPPPRRAPPIGNETRPVNARAPATMYRQKSNCKARRHFGDGIQKPGKRPHSVRGGIGAAGTRPGGGEAERPPLRISASLVFDLDAVLC